LHDGINTLASLWWRLGKELMRTVGKTKGVSYHYRLSHKTLCFCIEFESETQTLISNNYAALCNCTSVTPKWIDFQMIFELGFGGNGSQPAEI